MLAPLLFVGCDAADPDAQTMMRPVLNAQPSQVTQTSFPAYVTPQDIMTPEDAFFHHHLTPQTEGVDFLQWPLVKNLRAFGKSLADAPLRSSLATNSIYISDQPRAKPIQEMVDQCAEILELEPPKVYIQPGPPNAYVSGLQHPHAMVLTSDLLELYAETPEELRFIIGHELGHLKAEHLRTHAVGRLCVHMIGRGGRSSQSLLGDAVAAGSALTLLHWYRESECSADRCGLFCVGGDLDVAQQALMRLIHQTKPSNPLFDPEHKNFDPALVLKQSIRLREEPITKVISVIQQMQQDHPFVPERCARLSEFSKSEACRQVLLRRGPDTTEQPTMELISASVSQLQPSDVNVPLYGGGDADPFLRIRYAGQRFATDHKKNVRSASWSLTGRNHAIVPGEGIFLDLYDHNSTLAESLLGAARIPVTDLAPGEHTITTRLRTDVESPSTNVERPAITLRYRIVP
ncbi:M48 family metalloprotease [Stieleria varia]|nr:M48 family metalloprotease [Stieleria varia]